MVVPVPVPHPTRRIPLWFPITLRHSLGEALRRRTTPMGREEEDPAAAAAAPPPPPRLTPQQQGQLAHLQTLADILGTTRMIQGSTNASLAVSGPSSSAGIPALPPGPSRHSLLRKMEVVREIKEVFQKETRAVQQIADPAARQRAAVQALYQSRAAALRLCAITESSVQGDYELTSYDHYVDHFDDASSRTPLWTNRDASPARPDAERPSTASPPNKRDGVEQESPPHSERTDLKDVVLGRKRPPSPSAARTSPGNQAKGQPPWTNQTSSTEVDAPDAPVTDKKNDQVSNAPVETSQNDRETVDPVVEATAWEERIQRVREYYQGKGYRVHSGLQFGCELVLYADDPSKVHSDFCVHVVPEDGLIDWRMVQSLVRLMPDLHKTLLLATLQDDGSVRELALTSEHGQFRQKHVKRASEATQVGHQRKLPRRTKHDTQAGVGGTTEASESKGEEESSSSLVSISDLCIAEPLPARSKQTR